MQKQALVQGRSEVAAKVLAFVTYLTDHCIGPLMNKTSNGDMNKAIACYVAQKNMEALDEYFIVEEPRQAFVKDHEPYYTFGISRRGPASEIKFVKKLFAIDGDTLPHVSFIEPKEYAQNISDVAQRESMLNLALGLSIGLPNGIGASNYSNFVRQSQSMLHSIARRPLVMSYNRYFEFGWVLAPKFGITKNGEAVFDQQAVRHSFAATVQIPAWHKFACIRGNYRWVDKDSFDSSKQIPLW